MEQRAELSAWLRLAHTPGLGRAAARKALAAFGSAQAVFDSSLTALAQVVGSKLAQVMLRPAPQQAALLEQTWSWLHAQGDDELLRDVITMGDPHYPQRLLAIADPPLLLYVLGARQHLNQGPGDGWPARALAIVGSRRATPQGVQDARAFARYLCAGGLSIVSGLALGIDGAAHEGALEAQGPGLPPLATMAVVGTGLDRVYPRQHQDLARQVAARGLLVSEYALGTKPLPQHFPRRNRLIAGLAQGVLVVEAALKSGSLVTARLASEQGKEVFAIPGSIHNPHARGCHALLRQGAKLVESAQDILEELQWPAQTQAVVTDYQAHLSAAAPEPGSDQAVLLEALGSDPATLDALQARTGLQADRMQAALLQLELEGRVSRLPGGLFQQLHQA